MEYFKENMWKIKRRYINYKKTFIVIVFLRWYTCFIKQDKKTDLQDILLYIKNILVKYFLKENAIACEKITYEKIWLKEEE